MGTFYDCYFLVAVIAVKISHFLEKNLVSILSSTRIFGSFMESGILFI